KTITSRRLGKDRAVSSLLELEVSFLRDRHCCRFRPVFLSHFILRLSVRYFGLARPVPSRACLAAQESPPRPPYNDPCRTFTRTEACCQGVAETETIVYYCVRAGAGEGCTIKTPKRVGR